MESIKVMNKKIERHDEWKIYLLVQFNTPLAHGNT